MHRQISYPNSEAAFASEILNSLSAMPSSLVASSFSLLSGNKSFAPRNSEIALFASVTASVNSVISIKTLNLFFVFLFLLFEPFHKNDTNQV